MSVDGWEGCGQALFVWLAVLRQMLVHGFPKFNGILEALVSELWQLLESVPHPTLRLPPLSLPLLPQPFLSPLSLDIPTVHPPTKPVPFPSSNLVLFQLLSNPLLIPHLIPPSNL